MNIEQFQKYCQSLAHTELCFPFDEVTLAFKVKGKIYAITSLEYETFTVNLKCDPDKAEELRDQYDEVQPGYHMNKKHWNTVNFEGKVPDKMLKEWIDHSYNLVVSKLPKKDRF